MEVFDGNVMSRHLGLGLKGFFLTHAFIPGVLLGVLFVALELSGLDLWISAHFYDPISLQWPYKEAWLIQKVFHKGGRLLYFAIIAVIGIVMLWSFKSNTSLKKYKLSLGYLFLASITGPIIIMKLKKITHVYCPWDLQLFGGPKPYIRLFDPLIESLTVGNCFPAAHAGSGFAFISTYFFLMIVHPTLKVYGLFFGLSVGGLYGITQQMRGAHFLSHDVISLAICWFSAVILFLVFFRKQIHWT